MTNYAFLRDVDVLIGVRNGGGLIYENQWNYANLSKRTNIAISFTVNKSVKMKESTGSINLTGVSYDSYKFLTTETENLQIILKVGHETLNNKETIFQGDLTDLNFQKQGSANVLSLTAQEGLYEEKVGVLRRSYPPNTLLTDIIKDCEEIVKGLGLETLDVFKIFSKMDKDVIATAKLANGFTANDNVMGVLRVLLSHYNYYVYINKGRLIVAHPYTAIYDSGYVFDYKHGLIGNPYLLKDGSIKFKALINPMVTLGSRVGVETDNVKGDFIVSDISYQGDNKDGDFSMDIEAL